MTEKKDLQHKLKEYQELVTKIISDSEAVTYHLLFSTISLSSIVTGAYVGYMHGQGNHLENENLETMLLYCPPFLNATLGASVFGGIGFNHSEAIQTIENPDKDQHFSKYTLAAMGGLCGGIPRGAKGGIYTLIGYGIGYLIGAIGK